MHQRHRQGGADPADPSLAVMEQAIQASVRALGEAIRVAGVRAE